MLNFIKENWFKAIIVVLFLVTPLFVYARSGCCSWHGGVCGCRCCDGTSLSATCAPYYPGCNNTTVLNLSAFGVKSTSKPVAKTSKLSDSLIDTLYYNTCYQKDVNDKFLFRKKGVNYYDDQCSIYIDSGLEKFIINSGLASNSINIHKWAYNFKKYMKDNGIIDRWECYQLYNK
ncbi:MAG: hypothetical protein WC619_01790 [Patescibacteria group bacterium]